MLSALWTWFFGQRPEREIVKLSAIPTWTELFSDNRQELEITLANGEEFACDPELNCKVSMYQGNITCLEVDGIVRSTNETLDAHGGVSGAVSEAAGPNLMKEIKTLNGCRTGKVKTTAGFLLPSKYIIHTVGPNGENRPLLESCYKECLKEMTVKPMRSLAFCCISAGNANYPIDSAVIVAVRTVREWLEDRKRERKLPEIDRIIFCLYSDMDTALYNHWMQVFFPCPLEQVVPSTSDDQTVPSDLTKLTTSLDSEERILQPLPGFIEISYEPCMVCFDDDPSKARSKMPCGHVIGPHCMAEYCKGQIDQGRSKFVCSAFDCKREWEYFLVRHVACLTQDEMQNAEKKLTEMNFVDKNKEFKRCPGCQTICYRQPRAKDRVRCPTCSAGGKNYDFCWICLKEWKGGFFSFSCGNQRCGQDDRLHILATCPTKTINFCKECPTTRGCPSCGMLIEHKTKCAHMECPKCSGYGFCFICLKPKIDGDWQCKPYLGSCKLVPRQNSLP